MAHKLIVNRDTMGERHTLPEGVKIYLSSNNSSAKYVVCGSNLASDNINDYLLGSVTGSAGGTLSRTVASGTGIPTISMDSSGNLVHTQGTGTGRYAIYPVGMFYVNETSVVTMSATVKNSGSTDGAAFTPMIAIVDCSTGLLVDRYSGSYVTATAQGASMSYGRTVDAGYVVMCYLGHSTAVASSVTTFEDYAVTCAPVSMSDLLPSAPYEAKRLTGDGSVTSFAGVNNIMCSDLNFHVAFTTDYVNNPVGLLPSATGVSF